MDTFWNYRTVKPLLSGLPWDLSRCSLKGKYHDDANFGTKLSIRLIEGVCLIGGLLNRGFTVHIFKFTTDSIFSTLQLTLFLFVSLL